MSPYKKCNYSTQKYLTRNFNYCFINNSSEYPAILKLNSINNTNIVKVVTDTKKNVLYLSRANIPYEFKKINKFIKKHLSIISFKPESLIKFSKNVFINSEKIGPWFYYDFSSLCYYFFLFI